MAKRRRRSSYTRRGEPYYRSSRPARLPPAHERVRRLPQDPDFRVTVPFVALRQSPARALARRLSVFLPPAATPLRRRGVSRRYEALRQLPVAVPRKVRFCVERKRRREVIFAIGVGGRRGSAPGPYRRTQESQYAC